MPEIFTGTLGLVLLCLLFVLALLWCFLPFEIFGIKGKLAELIAQSKATNAELAKIAQELAEVRKQASVLANERSIGQKT